MTRGTLLSLLNVSLLAGLVVATTDVVAQQQPTTGTQIIFTECGSGTLEPCGEKDLFHCEWRFDIRFSSLPFHGGITLGPQHCVKAGRIPLYKNRPATYVTCTQSSPSRPPGEDDGLNYLTEEESFGLCAG